MAKDSLGSARARTSTVHPDAPHRRCESRIGPVSELNRRSRENRAAVERWMAGQDLLQLCIPEPESRGTAMTLLRIADPAIVDPAIHVRIVTRSKQLLGYDGDPVGLRRGTDCNAHHSAVKCHIEAHGGVFHEGPLGDRASLEKGRIRFFYQPDFSTEAELLPITDKGQYDAAIAAATFLPKGSVFPEGGVRIGAGTGNMGSASWGGGNGAVGNSG